MAKHGKKHRAALAAVEPGRTYALREALEVLQRVKTAKFDETAELAFRLGVDPTKSDQMVRGSVTLPHGTGKKVTIAVFAEGPAAEAAREAGADHVGLDDLVAKVTGGWTDFDVAIATPDAMKEVRKLGRQLGPRGLMPNPRTGTVTDDVASAVKQFQAGRVEFKMDKNGNLHVPFGKLSFDAEALAANGQAVVEAVLAAKPMAAKGVFVRRCTVTSTMGPGLPVQVRDTTVAA